MEQRDGRRARRTARGDALAWDGEHAQRRRCRWGRTDEEGPAALGIPAPFGSGRRSYLLPRSSILPHLVTLATAFTRERAKTSKGSSAPRGTAQSGARTAEVEGC